MKKKRTQSKVEKLLIAVSLGAVLSVGITASYAHEEIELRDKQLDKVQEVVESDKAEKEKLEQMLEDVKAEKEKIESEKKEANNKVKEIESEKDSLEDKVEDLKKDLSAKKKAEQQAVFASASSSDVKKESSKPKAESKPKSESQSKSKPKQVSNQGSHLLAKLVTAEAKGESLNGKIAVAEVVLNRVESSKFPDTLKGVIYQGNQFSPVSNGAINNVPTSDAKEAVRIAMQGTNKTGGALFFYNDSIVSQSWLESKQTTTRIGNHVFKK